MRIAPLLVALLITTPAVAAPPRDARLWAAAQAARAEQLKLLEAAVNLDSGTGDAVGGKAVADLLVPRLEALGMQVERIPAEEAGLPDNIVARLRGGGRGRILMIAHLDTVFEAGTARSRPFRIDGDRAFGPGVGDEKGGVVEGIFAIGLLRELGVRDFRQITLLIETSEERGSPGARKLIGQLLSEADVELNLEPGDPPDALTVWRKGSTTFQIHVTGRAAHAGVAPQEGRNAAVELIHQVQAADVFPKSGEGLTANLTGLKAGTRHNIIPDDALAMINVRVRTPQQFDEVEQVLQRNAATTVVPDTKVTVSQESAYPPLPSNPETDALADRAARIYGELGRSIVRTGNGGASESALAAQAGVPALDGLGPVGGGFHSDGEYIDLTTVTPRLYLLTRLLIDLGARPPTR
jgi:glutamate carboxypeptidase